MAYSAFASFYDELMGDVDYEKITAFCVDKFRKNGIDSGILLDLGCGSGTLCSYFADCGFDVIGVDPSEEMLSRAREKTFDKNPSVLLLNQCGEELDLFGTVDLCVSTLDTLNHIETREGFIKTIGNVSLFMNKGGIFIFDVNTVYKHKNVLSFNSFVYENDDVFCVWRNFYNESDNSVDISLDFFINDGDTYLRDGDTYLRECEDFTELAFEIDDIKSICLSCGFEILGIFDNYTNENITDETERAVFVLRKSNE